MDKYANNALTHPKHTTAPIDDYVEHTFITVFDMEIISKGPDVRGLTFHRDKFRINLILFRWPYDELYNTRKLSLEIMIINTSTTGTLSDIPIRVLLDGDSEE